MGRGRFACDFDTGRKLSTMRAAVITELGRPPELADRPEPAGEAIYEIAAVSLNPIDINVGAGRYFGGHPELPYVAGCEGVGRSPDGTRVYLFNDGLGLARDGLLAERAGAPADLGIPLPEVVSDEIATSCGIAGMAGWMPVAWRAPVRKDDRVLVLGATSTVGLIAVQAAKLLGATHVVAAGRNPKRLERAAELGADATVNIEQDDLVTAFREATGGEGPTYIVDTLWGPPAAAAIQAAAPDWRMVQVGQSAGAEASLASAAVRGKMGELYGYTDFAVPKDDFREQYLRLVGHAAAGEITFDIETYPLEQVAEAWERQATGANAKIVVMLQ
jgi:NADPH:quinone reductase